MCIRACVCVSLVYVSSKLVFVSIRAFLCCQEFCLASLPSSKCPSALPGGTVPLFPLSAPLSDAVSAFVPSVSAFA